MSNARELAELGGSYGTGGFVGMKNRIINGAMMIDQRNNGATGTGTDAYPVDRFRVQAGASGKWTWGRNLNSVTPPAGYKYYTGISSSSAYSLSAGDYFLLTQAIEGNNIADLGFGAAGASSVTLSFWVRSSLTGTFSGSLMNDGQSRAYVFTYTINSANTWEQKTITVAGDTGGTWLENNGIGLYVRFSLGTGSTYSTSSTNQWLGTSYWSATGSTNVMGTNGATFYITGVQLEEGTAATAFEQRLYGTELALCQRYYWRWTAGYSSHPLAVFQVYNTSSAWGKLFDLPVPMRAVPTASTSGSFAATNAGASALSNFSTTSIAQNTTGMLATGAWTGSSGLVAGNATVVCAAAAGNYIDASAEL